MLPAKNKVALAMQLLLIVQWLQQHLYQLQYGGDDGKYASDHSDDSDDLCASLDDDEEKKPNGLVFSDDDNFLIDIDYHSEDERL